MNNSSMHYRRTTRSSGLSADVGFEAPLITSDARLRVPDRRSVNLRWFAGTVLTGITSVVLMGGALFAAIDASDKVLEPRGVLSGSFLQGGIRGGGAGGKGAFGGSTKGNRFHAVIEAEPARKIVKASTVHREGDRDYIKLVPFVHIKAPLAVKTTGIVANIPAFNPLAVYTEEQPQARQEELPTISNANVNGEISIQVRDYPIAMGAVDSSAEITDAQALEDILEITSFLSGEQPNVLAVSDPTGALQTAADNASVSIVEVVDENPEQFNITIVDENVSYAEKLEPASNGYVYEERIVTVNSGDTLSKILQRENATKGEVNSAVGALKAFHNISVLKTGQRLRIAVSSSEDDTKRVRPVRISLYTNKSHIASVALSDEGQFIKAAEPYLEANLNTGVAPRIIPGGKLPDLYDSLYQTGMSLEMPEKMVAELIRIFSYDLDFQKSVTPRDAISLLHSQPEEGSGEVGHVLFAEISVGGNTKQFYRFRTPDDGYVDYYDASGRSAKKFLMRKPIAAGSISSKYGMRKHPITGRRKMHNGTDWRAPSGTKIYAAGDGTVSIAKWNGGYGRHVRIKHANRYETSYSHMTRFASGIKAGARVRQGQLIGYVGTTGFSTGPHLHYEMFVNRRNVNPMRIKLPRGRVLKADMLERFQKEQQRINELIEQGADTKVASAN